MASSGQQQPHDDEDTPFVPERGFYQPSSEETWEAYQALLSVVEYHARANLPRAVLCGVADEVLWVMKSNSIRSLTEKKVEIEKILNPFPDFMFDQLVSTAKLITDYNRTQIFVSEKDFYQPRREDTRGAYKLLIDFVNGQFGCQQQPEMVQCIFAHEVLVILKDTSIENSLKRRMIENTLNVFMSDDEFDTLLFIGELITDFSTDAAAHVGTGNESYIGEPNSNQPTPPVPAAGFQSDCASRVSDRDRTMHPAGSSGVSLKDEYSSTDDDDDDDDDDEESMCLGFENVHIADKEDEGDWVMVDLDPDM